VRFADFEVDLPARDLRRSGARVRVQEQSFQVLEALLERPGQIVTREELRNRLWRADTFVDFEDGLNTAIRKLRVALDDSPATPRFIETIPRRGYRFVQPVHATDDEVPKTSATDRRIDVRMWWFGAGAVALGLLAVSVMTSRDGGIAAGVTGLVGSMAIPHGSRARPAVPREAFDALVEGRQAFHRGTPSGSTKARELFQRAIEKDSGYAEAYASLAELYVRGGAALVGDPLEGRVNARKWAKQALEIDDTLAEHTRRLPGPT
jgi:DNA-binding winged helix-turn-helix (wHTH) protein